MLVKFLQMGVKQIFRISAIVAIVLMTASCRTTYLRVNYLQDIAAGESESVNTNEGIIIQPKDMLSIVVSCRNPELAVIFNLPVVSYQAGAEMYSSGTSTQRLLGYVVDNDGDIDFPVLGKIHVAGLSRWALSEEIKRQLIENAYITDPVITVQFMNFKISVMGEVSAPGTYSIDGDKVTLLEALSLAKDMTIYGRRDNVAVIREQDGERVIYQVDVRSKDMFQSPAYYLQQNDIVYVTPNKVRAGQSTLNENSVRSVSMWVSISSLLISIATLIVSAH